MTYALLVLQQIISASTHLIAKSVTGALHPTTVVLFRGLFTCLAYGIWVGVRRKHLRVVDREDLPLLALLGLINLPINQLLFIWGVKYTTAPNAALAYALTPVFVVLLLWVRTRNNPGRRRLFGVALALIGAAIVLIDKGASISPQHTLGNIMVLGASASWAVYTVAGRRLVMKYGAFHATALTFFSGILFYVPLFMVLPVPADLGPLMSAGNESIWMQLFYLGVITSGVGYGLWYYALTHLDAGKVAVFNNLQPIFTTIMALAIFGTQPTLPFLIGGVIALAGVVVTQKT